MTADEDYEDQLWAKLKDEGVNVRVLTQLADQNLLSVSGLVDTCRNSHLTCAQNLRVEVGSLDAFPLRVLSALNHLSLSLNAQSTTTTTGNASTVTNGGTTKGPGLVPVQLLSGEQTMILETAGRIWPNQSQYTAFVASRASQPPILPPVPPPPAPKAPAVASKAPAAPMPAAGGRL